MLHVLLALSLVGIDSSPVLLSTANRARPFGGVGGISGGGATSRTLFDYAEPAITQMLDLLWKPQYGVSLQTVKVEIPADADTTCGSEVAHRHDADDGGSCLRGYEGWFLSQALKRVPGIASSSLQWAAPKFVGEPGVSNGSSLFTATNINEYVLPWLRCMRDTWGVNLTYMGGGWNEKPLNATYIKLLRSTLDATGEGDLEGVGIAAADDCCGSNWNIATAMAEDPELAAAVDVISTHVAGSLDENTPTPQVAIDFGIPLWQGEEHFGLPDPEGVPAWEWAAAAATGIQVSQNWVINNMSATIYWPAVYGWSSGIVYRGKGLLVATSPWGAAPYSLPVAAWVVAHTTHFTEVGWSLLNETGAGGLGGSPPPRTSPVSGSAGGYNYSYVTYVEPQPASLPRFTLVVESFLAGGVWNAEHDSSHAAAAAATAAASPPIAASFILGGDLTGWANGVLHVWHTNTSVIFEQEEDIAIASDGSFSLTVEAGAIYTLTVVESSHPGAKALCQSLGLPPPSVGQYSAVGGAAPPPTPSEGPVDALFPLPFFDDFESYANDTLPLFSGDMFGAFTTYQLPVAEAEARQGKGKGGLEWTQPFDSTISPTLCSTEEGAKARPHRCATYHSASPGGQASSAAPSNRQVLRQWTRQPPIGWGGESSNMATIYGNYTLQNVNLTISALIETIEPGYNVSLTPYVLFGIHAGNGQVGGTGPGAFYKQNPDADFYWVDVNGNYGCSFNGPAGNVCTQPAQMLPSGPFGYDTWHNIGLTSTPFLNGSSVISVVFDGSPLISIVQTQQQQKNSGRGGYVTIVTGCHRAQFDNLFIQETTASQ